VHCASEWLALLVDMRSRAMLYTPGHSTTSCIAPHNEQHESVRASGAPPMLSRRQEFEPHLQRHVASLAWEDRGELVRGLPHPMCLLQSNEPPRQSEHNHPNERTKICPSSTSCKKVLPGLAALWRGCRSEGCRRRIRLTRRGTDLPHQG
jgi:hypothetical protein